MRTNNPLWSVSPGLGCSCSLFDHITLDEAWEDQKQVNRDQKTERVERFYCTHSSLERTQHATQGSTRLGQEAKRQRGTHGQ